MKSGLTLQGAGRRFRGLRMEKILLAAALGRIGREEAVQALKKAAATDPNEVVRNKARKALGEAATGDGNDGSEGPA